MEIHNDKVACPFCGILLDVGEDKWVQVDAPGTPIKLFCSWKHLGRWVIETYEQGKQGERLNAEGRV